MNDLIFKNVLIPRDGALRPSDVTINRGLIVNIDFSGSSSDGRQIVEGNGRLLLPGAVDMHVHLREPGGEHKEDIASGTMAARQGGVTTVADMPNNSPLTADEATFLKKAAIADATAACDVKLFIGLTGGNIPEIRKVIKHPRFAGIKVFLGATTGSLLCGLEALREAAAELDCLFAFHAESDDTLKKAGATHGPGLSAADHLKLRPVEAAVDAVCDIASVYRPGMRFHICHVSSADELAAIAANPGITCEVSPHHLAFSELATHDLGNLAKMNPPLRCESDRIAVMKALVEGRIDCIATDHAPHTLAEKARPYPEAPAGVPGLDTLVPYVLSLVQNGTISLETAMRLISTRPAQILGLTDRGEIREGLRADMFLWDPASTWHVNNQDIKSKCGWTPFAGMTLAGRPSCVCMNGQIVSGS
jgi:dihydroorotase